MRRISASRRVGVLIGGIRVAKHAASRTEAAATSGMRRNDQRPVSTAETKTIQA